MKIIIHNQTKHDVKTFEKTLKKVFKSIKDKRNMHIIFVTPSDIQKLNQSFRQKDKPTDVLSFENDHPEDQTLGDIFINLNQAFEQANIYGHTILREVCFLAVHGYLHLKGYDHQTEEDEVKMIQLQDQILNQANIQRR